MKNKLLTKENLEKIKIIAIYGDIGTGKTALAYLIINLLKKPVYFLKHPKPEIIEKLGYTNLASLEEIERLQDCVIFWDEPQLTSPIYDKKANRIVANVCSLARQLNITLVIASSDTRVFTKHNEAYFDLWCVKDVDFEMVKQGSKIKKAIRRAIRRAERSKQDLHLWDRVIRLLYRKGYEFPPGKPPRRPKDFNAFLGTLTFYSLN